ncbi:response regulator [Pyxidicoccus fallax]|uniref:histidine kinase n=1 Tax=Pyxidicoccus fallax TaxID=394095 RepID=A0A848LFG4_9BACT|nr:ATP-binding protein [Pyxidicoccus fallax]NMO15061.1 response regulator [Pyxidicoccus fallax]NPC78251.1 response regulator [Pyxidicoccus fallax]
MKARPLRSHLALLALGLLIPLVLFAAGTVHRFATVQRSVREQGMRETARALALAVDRELGQSIRALEVLSHSEPLARGDLKTFYVTCKAVVRSGQPWSALSLVDSRGRIVFTTDQPFGEAVAGGGDRPYVREVLEKGRPVIADFPLNRKHGPLAVVVAMPVRSGTAITGVLVALYSMRHFETLWSDQRIPAEWVGTLVDEVGIILSRSRGAERYVGTSARQEFIERMRSVSPEGFFPTTTVDGMEVYTAVARSQLVPWTVAFSAPHDVIAAPVDRSLLGLLVAGVLCCLIAAVWASWVGRRITQPLRALARAATDSAATPAAFTHMGPTGVSELEGLRVALARTTSLVAEREAALRAKMLEAESARAEAESANRAKDQFLAMLGHELRNPLAAITSGVKVLSVARDDARRERTRALVERQALHLARLVDDLLDVARVSSGRITLQKGPMDLSDCVRRALAALESSERTRAHQLEVDVAPAWLSGDDSRLSQVVTNLVSNALKYTPEGGRIRVSTREEGEHVVLEVSDTGVGLPADALPRVFDLFFQEDRSLDRSQGGLGVGLTLVKRLVDLHGGTVRASSEGPNQGSTFTVHLPRGLVEEAPRARSGAVLSASGRRLLLVEDHADSRHVVRQLLEAEGHTVFEAEDGPSGLARARELRPDAVLLDIGLPGMDGYAVARTLRATPEGRGLLLIALTGYGLREDRLRALQAGFDEHLVKPVDMARLREVLAAREAPVEAVS